MTLLVCSFMGLKGKMPTPGKSGLASGTSQPHGCVTTGTQGMSWDMGLGKAALSGWDGESNLLQELLGLLDWAG